MPLYVKPDTLAPWARAGVTAYLEIPRNEAPAELAIPSASLVQDGLDTFFFRRDPRDPDRVLPVKADLGPSDGRWITVRSGVKEGDEVVLEGAYALKLAGGASKAPEGYHYHADGIAPQGSLRAQTIDAQATHRHSHSRTAPLDYYACA